jgi:hypothetical protein
MGIIRGMGKNASRRVLRRSLSSPGPFLSAQGTTTALIRKKTTRRRSSVSVAVSPSESEAGVSSCAGSTDHSGFNQMLDNGIALSEIAVEEHVSDIITQA